MRPRLAVASVALLSLVCANVQAKGADLPLPRGYHKVPLDRFKGTYTWERRKSLPNGGLQVRGDFKGDGHVEIASILESKRPKRCDLALTELSGRRVVQSIYGGSLGACAKDAGAIFYVAVEPPSLKIKAASCDGGAYCEKGDPYTLRLVRPSIRFGYFGTGYSILFWDDKRRHWREAMFAE